MARAVSLLINLLNNMPFRDNRGQTPYIVAPDKDTRNVFRKYMGENPDRYDYKKAQVKSKLIACISLNINAYCLFFFNKDLFIWIMEGSWTLDWRDWVQTAWEEKSPECTEKTARKKTKGRKEATRAGGRGKKEVCVSVWPWKGELCEFVWF